MQILLQFSFKDSTYDMYGDHYILQRSRYDTYLWNLLISTKVSDLHITFK